MTQKTFYTNINEQNFNNIRAVNKNLSFKSLVVDILGENKERKIMENNEKCKELILNHKKVHKGDFLNIKSYVLKHKKDPYAQVDYSFLTS